jgi:putative FmdB family regulatory protein
MIRALPQELTVDVIVPVPLHRSRLRAREFNQSLLLADRVGRYLMRPVSTTDLVRVTATQPQTALNRSERLRNLRRTFHVRSAVPFAGRHVLLVDDVFTTGTTLNECAKALRAAGAESISALTLARTIDTNLVPDRVLAASHPGLFATAKELAVPIYEYNCLDCGKRCSILHLSQSASRSALCAHCGSHRLERLLSGFASPKSEEARMESLVGDASSGFDESDPASAERMMKHMGDELGEDVGNAMSEAVESSDDSASSLDDAGSY